MVDLWIDMIGKIYNRHCGSHNDWIPMVEFAAQFQENPPGAMYSKEGHTRACHNGAGSMSNISLPRQKAETTCASPAVLSFLSNLLTIDSRYVSFGCLGIKSASLRLSKIFILTSKGTNESSSNLFRALSIPMVFSKCSAALLLARWLRHSA